MTPQLKHPLDKQSKKIIEQAVDEFLDQKVFDLIWKRTFHWLTFFESLDGFGVTADAYSVDKDDVVITTSDVKDNEAKVTKTPAFQGLITFSQPSRMRTSFSISSVSDVTSYMIVGSTSSGEYYGFKIVDNSLKGVSYDGTTENAVVLQTISASTVYALEARMYPNNKTIFIVNTVEKGVSVSNLPSGITSGTAVANVNLMEFSITTGTTAAKTLQFSFFEYFQKRNVLK